MGETYDLGEGGESRRRFLRGLAAAGAGTAGLKAAIEGVYDDVPAGVPVVWTRDRLGRPERVRVVDEERHRRLALYRRIDVAALRDRHAGVDGVGVTASGPDADLALRVVVDRAGWSARRSLPSRIRRVPVVVDEREGAAHGLRVRDGRSGVGEQRGSRGDAERRTDDRASDGQGKGGRGTEGGDGSGEPPGCKTVCEEHITRFYDPVPAGVQVKGRQDGEVTRDGTLGLVAWNADPADPYECFVTANHVVSLPEVGGPAAFLFQSGLHEGEPRAENVGHLQRASPFGPYGVDAAKYEVLETVAGDPLASAAEQQPDVSGSWDFAGLADATAAPGDSVPVGLSGRSTCWAESRCTHTQRAYLVQHGAVVAPAVADAGDSGGAVLDDDGKLVCTPSTGSACDGVDHHFGPVGTTMLDRLGVSLSPPAVDWPG